MKHLILTLSILLTHSLTAFELKPTTTQAIVGISNDWNSSYVDLGLYEKKKGKWQKVGEFWKGRLGRNGSAWGLGLSPILGKNIKKEGDGRTPAGVFLLGDAYGYAKSIKKQSGLKFHTVTDKDLWVEDSKSPYYNRHLKIGHTPKTEWEKKQQMRQGDYAHALKLYIGHNTATEKVKAKAGYGSAIFFHIWRGAGSKSTSGCTTMDATKLTNMISKIDPKKNPVYIILPKAEYTKYRAAWKLP